MRRYWWHLMRLLLVWLPARLHWNHFFAVSAMNNVHDLLFISKLDLLLLSDRWDQAFWGNIWRNSLKQRVQLISVLLVVQIAVSLLTELVVLVLEGFLSLGRVGIVFHILHRLKDVLKLLHDVWWKSGKVERVAVELAEKVLQIPIVVIVSVIKLFEKILLFSVISQERTLLA